MSDRDSTPFPTENRKHDDTVRFTLPMPTKWNLGSIQIEATQRFTMMELISKLNVLESNVGELTNIN